MNAEMPCPCHSQKLYRDCCERYHKGEPPENALALMRSRYAAYALGLVDYIIATTHPKNSHYLEDHTKWKEEILRFSQATHFEGLTIHEFVDDAQTAYVTFTAILKQKGNDASFTEKSRFEKVDGRWLYRDGQMIPSFP